MDKNIKDINMELKRTEKLVSGLYLLTSFFDEKEPLKWKLRDLGSKLVSNGEKRNIVLEIMSLLTIAKNAGLVSETNFDIIHREFSIMVPQGQTLGEVFKRLEEKEVQVQPQNQERITEKPSLYLASSIPKSQIIKDRIHRETPKEGVVAVKKNSRQSIILNLLKKKKEIMIKDVSPLIAGVSEKTIQRELLALVSSGILRKIGEKRWSRYSLAE
jgi:hypothetical protein